MEKLTDLIKQQNEITGKIFNILREYSGNIPIVYAAHAQDDMIINNVAFFDPTGGESRYELELTREVSEDEQDKPEVFMRATVSRFKHLLLQELARKHGVEKNGVIDVDGEAVLRDTGIILGE